VLASSFGAEDMVLLDLIAQHAPTIGVFTLDTGRLPEETHALIDRARDRYGIAIDVQFPDATRVASFVRTNGVNAFYDSVELRQGCCAIRKTEPLARALAGKGAWITGLRRDQSVTRSDARTRGIRRQPRASQVQSARRLERGRRLELHPRAATCPTTRCTTRLSQHRLRALHARRRAGRECSRRALVVGKPGAARNAACTGARSRSCARHRRSELTP
jgi:hypothetical protein